VLVSVVTAVGDDGDEEVGAGDGGTRLAGGRISPPGLASALLAGEAPAIGEAPVAGWAVIAEDEVLPATTGLLRADRLLRTACVRWMTGSAIVQLAGPASGRVGLTLMVRAVEAVSGRFTGTLEVELV
jgi:hypothetical protein